MARRFRDKQDNIVRIELDAVEMAGALGLEELAGPNDTSVTAVQQLSRWTKLIPVDRKENGEPVYAISSVKDLNLLKKRAALLRTQMTEKQVARIEKQGLLDAYADLAADCPPGITTHVWRSYGVVVLMQTRYGVMLDAEGLAQRAGLSDIGDDGKRGLGVQTAQQHLRMLNAVGYLVKGQKESDKVDWTGQWKHRGLPEAWRGA
jgi:hypothetical protein